MQEDLGIRQGASRYAGARPLADLQQNVLSGPAKNLQQSYSSQTGELCNCNCSCACSMAVYQKFLKCLLAFTQCSVSFAGVTAKAIIPVAGADNCNLDPVQLRLKVMTRTYLAM